MLLTTKNELSTSVEFSICFCFCLILDQKIEKSTATRTSWKGGPNLSTSSEQKIIYLLQSRILWRSCTSVGREPVPPTRATAANSSVKRSRHDSYPTPPLWRRCLSRTCARSWCAHESQFARSKCLLSHHDHASFAFSICFFHFVFPFAFSIVTRMEAEAEGLSWNEALVLSLLHSRRCPASREGAGARPAEFFISGHIKEPCGHVRNTRRMQSDCKTQAHRHQLLAGSSIRFWNWMVKTHTLPLASKTKARQRAAKLRWDNLGLSYL